jgi:hypothetical protein
VFQSINVTDLQPYQHYHVRLSAYNEAGDGPWSEFDGLTDEEGMKNFIFWFILLSVHVPYCLADCSYCPTHPAPCVLDVVSSCYC